MTIQYPITTEKYIRFLNHYNTKTIFNVQNEALTSFAIDDAIAETVGNHVAYPTIRMWVHEPTIVLGIPDSRLPYIEDGLSYIHQKETNAVIRNSGGLAVFLDSGVLNMSMIIPNNRGVTIHNGYNMMYEFIKKLFKPYTDAIKAYEIVGSYCPGDYDLSIGGINFAGISQRRVRNGVAVQIYMDIEGSSKKRAKFVKEFYNISKRNEVTNYKYPDIDPQVMGTISELLDVPFTISSMIEQIKSLLQTDYIITDDQLLLEEKQLFYKRVKQMHKRNEQLR